MSEKSNGKEIVIPSRGPREELDALGLTVLGEAGFGYQRISVLSNWRVVPSQVSIFHQHLVDESGAEKLCLFSKPSGGIGSFQCSSCQNCAELAAR